jgi:hypothetical protein
MGKRSYLRDALRLAGKGLRSSAPLSITSLPAPVRRALAWWPQRSAHRPNVATASVAPPAGSVNCLCESSGCRRPAFGTVREGLLTRKLPSGGGLEPVWAGVAALSEWRGIERRTRMAQPVAHWSPLQWRRTPLPMRQGAAPPSPLTLVKPGRGRQARERRWPGRRKNTYLRDTLRLPAKGFSPSAHPIFIGLIEGAGRVRPFGAAVALDTGPNHRWPRPGRLGRGPGRLFGRLRVRGVAQPAAKVAPSMQMRCLSVL